MDKIEKLYLEYNFPGAPALWELAKRNNIYSVTQKEIKDFVANQKVSQLHKKPRKSNHPITTANPKFEYQMDLLDMSKFYNTNNHYKWILLVIDIFSRVGFAYPLKNKEAATVLEGVKKAFEIMQPPKVVASDNGSEFKGAVAKYLKELDVVQKMNEPGDFSQTIKNKLYKHFTKNNNTVER